MKSYSELIKFHTYLDRLKYLMLYGGVGYETFGSDRYINQVFYTSKEWLAFRNKIIVRDAGCDMGLLDFPLNRSMTKIIIHHINPISKEDILTRASSLFDEENVISVSLNTHNLIHYGDFDKVSSTMYRERTPDDTTLWKKGGVV